jgi:hypothetical protein
MAQPDSAQESLRAWQLVVPLDASQVGMREGKQQVKVLVQDGKGDMQSRLADLDEGGHAEARFTFASQPGGVHVILGPATATDDELTKLQTIAVDVSARQWGKDMRLTLRPIVIPPWYWWWWLRWCREFSIHGVVLCANGRPVPGAKVCAYDVDWWWWWSSEQLIQCATTDATGAFQMNFRWCCGWWHWWWWRLRYWRLDEGLVSRIAPVLQRVPGLGRLIRPGPQPSLADFSRLLGPDAAALNRQNAVDPALLAGLRQRLLKVLPQSAELERLRIWPWWPWAPWWDCAPDVIFRATQDCASAAAGGSNVIVNETIWDTRWDIPTTLDVQLTASENACCVPPITGCQDGGCLSLTEACSDTLDNIGGNIGLSAAATQIGFESPGAGTTYSDRPYAGSVSISGTTECMDGVDYYEFKWSTAKAGPYNDMPPAANGDVTRTYLQFTPLGFHYPPFSATIPIDGRHVYETLQHYEAANPPADWGSNRVWLGDTRDILTYWLTAGNFSDGTYYLQVTGWNIDAGGHLINPRVLKICDSGDDNYIVLTVDNRVVSSVSPDLHGNPCGPGTVHICTDEPDTAVMRVQIRHADGTLSDLSACGNAQVEATDTLEIDFVAHDPDGHLGEFELQVNYDTNLSTDLLALGTLSSSTLPVAGVPAAAQIGPNYALALGLGQGATSPIWNGGVLHLSVPATGPGGAFPYTCCYVLRLNAYKRTIVDCGYGRDGHANYSETSFTILV